MPNVKIKIINYFAWHTSTNRLGESYTIFYDSTDDQTKETPKCPNLVLLIPESIAHRSKVNV